MIQVVAHAGRTATRCASSPDPTVPPVARIRSVWYATPATAGRPQAGPHPHQRTTRVPTTSHPAGIRMLTTILIILAIICLVLFIVGRA
jgi:hypothetical protein